MIKMRMNRFSDFPVYYDQLVDTLDNLFKIDSNASPERIAYLAKQLTDGEFIYIAAPNTEQAAIAIYNMNRANCEVQTTLDNEQQKLELDHYLSLIRSRDNYHRPKEI